MFESNERLMLIVDMLDGVPESHKILADLLEESGDRGLAQWARTRKGPSVRRLGFALAVLPYRKSIEIGCHFLAAWLKLDTRVMGPLIEEIKVVWDWAKHPQPEDGPSSNIRKHRLEKDGLLVPAEVNSRHQIKFCGTYQQLARRVWGQSAQDVLYRTFQTERRKSAYDPIVIQGLTEFDSAVQWAEGTIVAYRNSDLGGQRNGVAETKNHIRKMVEVLCRNPNEKSALGTIRNPWWKITEQIEPRTYPKNMEMQLRIDYVKSSIAKMIESES